MTDPWATPPAVEPPPLQRHARTLINILAWASLPVVLAAWAGCGSAHGETYLTRCAGKGVEDGTTITSSPVPAAPGCASVALPIDTGQILAVVPAPRRRPNAPQPESITVTGQRIGDAFHPRSVAMVPVSASIPPPYLVPGSDLRAVAGVHGFGPLGRAEVQTDGDQTVLDCTAGSDSAGLAFATLRVPPIPGMNLRVVHSADQAFPLVVSDPAGNPRAPRPITELEAADSTSEGVVPLTAVPADRPLDLQILCPAAGGHLQLDEIVLEAKATVPTERAVWIDDPKLWLSDPARIFVRAERWGLTRLYIAVPMDAHGASDAQALAAFLAEANSRSIEVWALLRDDAATDGVIAQAAAALADFNQALPPTAQFKGAAVEYAPDRRWSYAYDPGAAAQGFLDRLAGVKSALDMPLTAIVPGWFPTDATLAERYAATLDGMVVLTDRTEPDDIRKAVTRFLAWGTRHGKPVEVAFETGPQSAEAQARFARADAGELWLITVGDERALLLLKEAAANLPGLAFEQQDSKELPAESLSFFGRRAALRESLDPLARTLGAWPSFAGFAFHGLFIEKN